jgi:hypothetical protein
MNRYYCTSKNSSETKRRQREELKDDVAEFINNGGVIQQVDIGEVKLGRTLTPSQQNSRNFIAAMDKKNGDSK